MHVKPAWKVSSVNMSEKSNITDVISDVETGNESENLMNESNDAGRDENVDGEYSKIY